jgi:SAM-dependent methyltransferase
MTAEFSNVYDDRARAQAYASLEFPGTYYLAYRDLPAIIGEHVGGGKAVDFGCGAGRSTRFLRELGFDAVGVDISEHMLALARKRDPEGEYRHVLDGDLGGIEVGIYDLVLSAFTFDNIPTMEKKITLFNSLKRLLNEGGRIVNLVSAPEIYINEWASFSTRDFPQNRMARCGDRVLIVMLDVEDRRPVEDILWTDEAYHDVYKRAGLVPLKTYRPLAKRTEPFHWVSETTIAPWVIYVLGPAETGKSSAGPLGVQGSVRGRGAERAPRRWNQNQCHNHHFSNRILATCHRQVGGSTPTCGSGSA